MRTSLPMFSDTAYSVTADPYVQSWVKADALALSDGANVTSWTASAGPNFATAYGTSPRPVFHTNIKNGLPAVLFGSSFSGIGTAGASPSYSQPFQFFLVFKAGATSSRALFAGVNGSASNGGSGSWFHINGSAHWAFICGLADKDLGSADTSWHIFFIEANGASSRYQKDNGAITTMASSPGSSGDGGAVLLGTGSSGDYIGEAIIRIGTKDPTPVFSYLNSRWAVY
jgi:hypothetical protein